MKYVVALLTAIGIGLVAPAPAGALGLQVQPLSYKTSLDSGEKKKGFVDISNPTGEQLRLKSSVLAFRQIDDRGGLEFYDDPAVSTGIVPDLEEFDLGPREAVRMYFLIDGAQLPPGDVFASLMVTTLPASQASGTTGSVRLGTLLVIENGQPGPRQATIESLDASRLQFGTGIHGSYEVSNNADPGTSSGFFPDVTVKLTPFGASKAQQAPLVMAGKRRQAEFTLAGDRLGVYRLSVGLGSSEQSRWILVATGYWQWLLPTVVAFATISPLLWKAIKRRPRGYFRAR